MSHTTPIKPDPGKNQPLILRRKRNATVVFRFKDTEGNDYPITDNFRFVLKPMAESGEGDHLIDITNADLLVIEGNEIRVPFTEENSDIDRPKCYYELINTTTKVNWFQGDVPIIRGKAPDGTVTEVEGTINIGEQVINVTMTVMGGGLSEDAEERIAALEAIIDANKPVNSVLPVISGTAEPGEILTASTGTWSNSPTSYAYQWKKDGVDITGETASTTTLGDDVGAVITASVIASNNFGSSAAAISAGVTVELGVIAPVNTVLPVISGTPQVGEVLTSSTGTWINEPDSYTYQWKRAGVAITGETNSTYTVVEADVDQSITSTVTATNIAGSTSATSAAVIGEAVAFDPSSLDNKAFWFRADDPSDGEVTLWEDRFAVGNAVPVVSRNTPNKVTNGGKAAIQFTRTNNEILRAPAITGITNYTLFIVFKANDTTNNQKLVGNGGSSDTTHGFDVSIQAGLIQVRNRNTVSPGNKTFAFTDTTSYHVLTIKWQTIGSGATTFFSRTVFKLDNVVKSTDSDARVLQSSSVGFDIGSDATSNSFDGYIREALCVKDWMTETEEQNMYTYLNSQWGMSVPTTMPAYTYSQGLTQSTDAKTATLGTSSLYTDYFEYGNYLDKYGSPLPVLILMHGYTELADTLGTAYNRLATLGFFVIGVQMRGRLSSTGIRDSSGQEVYDIYDVYQSFLAKYAGTGIIDPNRVIVSGYSGGGGNALAFATRFPDLCPVVVDHFGMSDYGYSDIDSWYIQEASRQAQLDTDVGSPRANFLNEYRVRNSKEAIAKNFRGKLFIFQDDQDSSVDIPQSNNVKIAYQNEVRSIQEAVYDDYDGTSDLRFSITTLTDATRWTHGAPTGTNGVIDAEPIWTDVAKTAEIPTLPDTGTLRILGWVRTKKFYILLGNGIPASDGKVRCADLTYDYVNNSYVITPLLESGAIDLTVAITVIGGAHDGKTTSGTISSETEFNPV